MAKKRLLFFSMILIVLTIFNTGCNNDLLKVDEDQISIELAGFPSDIETYDIKMYIEGDGGKGVKNVYQYTDISCDDKLKESFEIDKDADFIMVYLFKKDHYIDEPSYFRRIELKDNKKEYKNLYWLDYREYVRDKDIEYGISEQLIKNIGSTFSEEITFDEKPYYLYKLSNTKDQDIKLEVKSSTGKVFVDYASELDNGFLDNSYGRVYSDSYEKYISTWFGDNLYLLIIAEDYSESTDAVINIESENTSYIENEIIEMVAGSTPDIVYALDDNSNLHYINPETRSIEKEFSLSGINNPVTMEFSSFEDKLYILSEDSEIFVWDTVNDQISNIIPFLTEGFYIDPYDIEVSSKLGYIYVSSSGGITLIDINDEKVSVTLKENENDFRSIVLDEDKELLFADINYTGLQKYSINIDNTLTELQTNSRESFGDILLASTSGKLIMRDYNYLSVYDTDNISIMLEEIRVENLTDYALSPDGSILYLADSYRSLKLIDMEDYSQIKELYFDNSDGAQIITNSDGSVLVAGAASSVYGDEYVIHYFDDIQQ